MDVRESDLFETGLKSSFWDPKLNSLFFLYIPLTTFWEYPLFLINFSSFGGVLSVNSSLHHRSEQQKLLIHFLSLFLKSLAILLRILYMLHFYSKFYFIISKYSL